MVHLSRGLKVSSHVVLLSELVKPDLFYWEPLKDRTLVQGSVFFFFFFVNKQKLHTVCIVSVYLPNMLASSCYSLLLVC